MILFAPFAAKAPSLGGKPSPKDYPHAEELARLLENDHEVIQVGGGNDEIVARNFRLNPGFSELGELIQRSDIGICCDSYLQHYYWYLGKRAIVLFGISDPLIFGHPENLNLLVDRRFLRRNQFDLYYTDNYKPEAFVTPEQVLSALNAEQQLSGNHIAPDAFREVA